MTELLQHFSNHHDQLLYLTAGLSFILELTVMGLGGPLLFFAIACFITAMLTGAGFISGWEAEAFTLGILTAVIALLLWKPLKHFQNSSDGTDNSSDMIGRQVPTSSEVTLKSGSIRYSGINWNARLTQDCTLTSIPVDTNCIIVAVDGNIMLVEP